MASANEANDDSLLELEQQESEPLILSELEERPRQDRSSHGMDRFKFMVEL
jgi:hypothetical protein